MGDSRGLIFEQDTRFQLAKGISPEHTFSEHSILIIDAAQVYIQPELALQCTLHCDLGEQTLSNSRETLADTKRKTLTRCQAVEVF